MALFPYLMTSKLSHLTKIYTKGRAMYKTRKTGTGNGMRGTRGMGGMLYSRECRQTLQGMSSNILGNIAKHSRE